MIKTKSVLSFIQELNDEMEKNELIMVYTGDLSQSIMNKVLLMAENKFDTEGDELFVKKRVFNVMTESLQNMCKHQETFKDSIDIPPIFAIGLDNDHYMIISGNIIANDKIDVVSNIINKVNGLDKIGLKALYKEARLNSRISEVGGAGLGFIDMARKSENRLQFKIEPINEEASYFTLQVKISRTEENKTN